MIQLDSSFEFAFSYVPHNQHTKHDPHFSGFRITRFVHVLQGNQHYIDRVLEPILHNLLFAMNCLSFIMYPVVLV